MPKTGDRRCPECPHDWAEGRWSCAQGADWLDVSGNAPWGPPDSDHARLRFLAAMNDEEQHWLAAIAFENLDAGVWQGCPTPNGGWEDGEPWSEEERQWRSTARDFHERYAGGERTLTEGMLHHAGWDLGRELAWKRGWCPGREATIDSSWERER